LQVKSLIVTAIVALLGGVAVQLGIGAQVIGPIMLLLLVVLPVAGILTTIEDDLRGGFSNPEGKTRGPWRHWENWADLAVRAALCGVGFAIDAGWRTPAAILPWIFGAASIAVLVMFGGRIYRGDSSRTEDKAG
jgi:hypothetical protein